MSEEAEAIIDALEQQAMVDMGLASGDEPSMSDEALARIVSGEITDAATFIDTEISPLRAKAVEYYLGKPLGNEVEGRSQIVSRDVHDTISAVLPDLLRIFFGPENIVEFAPEGPEDQQAAEQATDYVNYIVTRDNPGFQVFQSAFKDALRAKVGFVKYWFDTSKLPTTTSYTGIDPVSLTILLEGPDADPSSQMTEVTECGEGLFDVKVTTAAPRNRIRIEAVPPEELLIDRRAKSIDDATLVAHRRMVTVSELVAMGYDRELVLDLAGSDDELGTNDERLARSPTSSLWSSNASDDPSMRLVLYVEAYINVDYDGDGIAELRRVCTIGTGHRVVHNDAVDERPFAAFPCDPEPHTFFGESLADKTMDVQLGKTVVLRNTLDSLALSLYPRLKVLEGKVNMDDAMNPEIGAFLRVKDMNAVDTMTIPFVGQAAFPILEYFDDVRENRTGMAKAAMGLDPAVMQSSTKEGVVGALTAAQRHVEIIARVFAEVGMKRLFRGILRLLVQNRASRTLLLRNEAVTLDPRGWRADMDVVANVALGAGTSSEKIAMLNGIADKQENILAQMGLNNPLVTPKHLFNTYSKILALSGYKAPDAFFTDPSKAPPAPPSEPPPTPEQVLAQVEKMKAEKDIQIAHSRMELEAQKVRLQDDRERDKIEADVMIKAYAAAAKVGGDPAVLAQTIISTLRTPRTETGTIVVAPQPSPDAGAEG